jgi:sigma-E factor negative regulatory protein RseA
VVIMKEQLSALIDGELDGDGLHAHLGRLRTEPELRGAWDTYHLIGDALRGQISPEIAARVVARLREEPTVLAPRPENRNRRGRLGWYAMSAAAGTAAVAFVVWTASPGWRAAEPQLAAGPASSAAGAPAATLVSALPLPEVQNYLLAHQPYSHASAMQGIGTYVRSAALEHGVAGK